MYFRVGVLNVDINFVFKVCHSLQQYVMFQVELLKMKIVFLLLLSVVAVSCFPSPRAESEPLFGNVLSDIIRFFLPTPRPPLRPHRPRPRPRPLAPAPHHPAPASYGALSPASYAPLPPSSYGYLPSYSPTPVSYFILTSTQYIK